VSRRSRRDSVSSSLERSSSTLRRTPDASDGREGRGSRTATRETELRIQDKGREDSPPEVRDREFAGDQSGEVLDHPLRRVDKVRLE